MEFALKQIQGIGESQALERTCRKTLVSCAQWRMHCRQLAASKANFLAAAASLPLATGGS